MSRQIRRPRNQGHAGRGIDRYGGPVIDPTENVLYLVEIEKEQNKLTREVDQKNAAELRATDMAWSAKMHAAAQQRLDDIRLLNRQLMEQANAYQDSARANDIIHSQEQVGLLSSQLDRLTNTIGERLSRLEQFRYEITGKSTGRSDVLSYVVAVVSLLIAAATVLWRTHS